MREQDVRKSIVEEAAWVIRVAEGTVGQGRWTIGEIEATAIDGRKTSSKGIVKIRQQVFWSKGSKSGVQNVGGRLKARGCQGPQVLRREIG